MIFSNKYKKELLLKGMKKILEASFSNSDKFLEFTLVTGFSSSQKLLLKKLYQILTKKKNVFLICQAFSFFFGGDIFCNEFNAF